MDFSIEVKNADENMLKALKAVLKTAPSVEFRMRRGKSRLDIAISEAKSGKTTKCRDFEDFKRKVLDEVCD